MKKIKTYNNYINESLKDKLKGKSDDEIIDNIKYLPIDEQFAIALQHSIISLIKELITNNKIDPSKDDNIAIRWAASVGNLEVVKELLKDERVDPSRVTDKIIDWALENGHTEMVKLLRSK